MKHAILHDSYVPPRLVSAGAKSDATVAAVLRPVVVDRRAKASTFRRLNLPADYSAVASFATPAAVAAVAADPEAHCLLDCRSADWPERSVLRPGAADYRATASADLRQDSREHCLAAIEPEEPVRLLAALQAAAGCQAAVPSIVRYCLVVRE